MPAFHRNQIQSHKNKTKQNIKIEAKTSDCLGSNIYSSEGSTT